MDARALRKALLDLRASTLSAEPAKIEPNRTDAATVGVPDEDAQALSEMMQTLASQRNRKQAEQLSQIDRALRRLSESPDDAGVCESCEEEIPDARLALLPYATLCAECQSKRDPKRGQRRRSVTEYE